MSQEAEFAASAESRIKDLEQALVATKHLLAKADRERDDARAQVEALQADLRRATEGRNHARESLRAQAFEMQLLRDEPAEKRLAAVTAERDSLQRAVDIAAEEHAALESERAELARRLAALDATAAAQLNEACDLLEAERARTDRVGMVARCAANVAADGLQADLKAALAEAMEVTP